MADKKMFEVVTPISSIHYGRDFIAGDVIDLGFASEEDISALVASGAVRPSKKQTMTPLPEPIEVKEGKNA